MHTAEATLELFQISMLSEKVLYSMYVLWIPDLSQNLLSIGASAKHGNKTIIEEGQIKIVNNRNQIIMLGYNYERNLYMMDTRVVLPEHDSICRQDTQSQSVWHEQLCHVSYKKLYQMMNSTAVTGLNVSKINRRNDNRFCEACIYGKQTQKQFIKPDTCAKKPAETSVVSCRLRLW